MGGSMAAEFDPRYYQDLLEGIRMRVDGADLKYPVETHLLRGLEADGILRHATEVGSDLIVMGTHGRTGMGRLMMGSVAESVLARADCPVIVLKSSQLAPASTSGQPAEHKSTIVF
jgi:nucleotide-binding universal stress UspA family protein